MFGEKFFVHWNYESLKEYLFLSLIAIEYEDYLNLEKTMKVGVEDPSLTGALILFQNTPKKKFYDVSDEINTIKAPIKILRQEPSFFRELLQGDGAMIIEGTEAISNGVFLDGLVRACKRKCGVKDFDQLFERYFPKELNKPGNRTRTGLALALTGTKNGSVFVMNQTVYNKLGAGRILEYTKKGVRRSFHLEKEKKKLIGIIKKYQYDENEKQLVLECTEVLTEKNLQEIYVRLKEFKKEKGVTFFHKVFSASKKLTNPLQLLR
jgi:hypothetical protein